ncbi:MAG TPA: hypothetical protein VMV69_13775 [Pirellulales bacterium]|nr:hypothetical protein [Pirellulales bacterium]
MVQSPETAASCLPSTGVRKLRRLVTLHLLLSVVPATGSLVVPPEMRFISLRWALASVFLGQLMLLSFWGGMGTSRGIRRLAGALLGCAYLAIWPTLASMFRPSTAETPPTHWIIEFLTVFGQECIVVVPLTGAFLAMRKWFSELRLVPDSEDSSAPARVQYSILSVLVVTAVIAVVLGLLRRARSGELIGNSDWRMAAANILGIVIYLIDTLCAAWAALGTGRVGPRVFLVCLVASLLGVVLSFAAQLDMLGWWLIPCLALDLLIAIAVVVVSLLVVRSCGYRLVPKTTARLV